MRRRIAGTVATVLVGGLSVSGWAMADNAALLKKARTKHKSSGSMHH